MPQAVFETGKFVYFMKYCNCSRDLILLLFRECVVMI